MPLSTDPTMPYTEIEIFGKTYKMAATHRALAIAEDYLVRTGHDVNLLLAKLRPTLSGIRAQFAASLHHFHPDIPFDEAQELVHDGNLAEVINKLSDAGTKAEPVKVESVPPAPGGEAEK